MAKLLEIDNLTTRFYTEDGVVHAVNGITFDLDEGESMAIVGESGSGKSVSMKSIMGIIPSPPGRIEDGRVMFNERDLLKLSNDEMRRVRGREMAMIFQDPMTSLNPVLTVGMQLTEALVMHLGMKQEQADERAAELLTLVGVGNPADRLKDYPHQFSGGQRQRIGIAMALSCNPSLLIADEPTTALDVTIQAQIVDLVLRLKQQLGMAIIWITHDLGVIAGMVDKIIVMYAGFIVENAPVRGLYKQTAHPYTVGLLESLPKVDARRKERLIPIKGLPPDLLRKPTRCPFAPRCPYNIERCWEENPPLIPVAPDHSSACWRAEEVFNGLRIHEQEQLDLEAVHALAAATPAVAEVLS
ncbi:oligopeptide transporter subunit; ATP-binding component of ABC superfamily [Candidatus Promineifilum breve]|uniref:Oligopeptide transporter subunit ATP-binding component of ABC superfamily n=1 Tax=Candidatus Promineifilum breve TaxID=1806508 RepID=A0A160T5G1_9CHLR|nr:ABC transporter ATP-binding protein [Candidatus Promineifilum breve]CUS04075.2 oligopeptide transporter subunit; ATP-binding component of ABC superfamily [Candidatus Promineifilum breve]